jgi:hypothetical protein
LCEYKPDRNDARDEQQADLDEGVCESDRAIDDMGLDVGRQCSLQHVGGRALVEIVHHDHDDVRR